MRRSVRLILWLLALFFLAIASPATHARSHIIGPRPSVILRSTPGYIVLSGMKQSTRYDGEGKPVHVFDLETEIDHFEVSPDERYLLARGQGQVMIWSLADGHCVHHLSVKGSLGTVCFSGDGSRFCMVIRSREIMVIPTEGNGRTCQIPSCRVSSVALGGDGTTGIAILDGGVLARLNVERGSLDQLNTQIGGWRAVRITNDGRFALLSTPSDHDRDKHSLAALDMQTGKLLLRHETEGQVQSLRPLEGGAMLASVLRDTPEGKEEVGMLFDPGCIAFIEVCKVRCDIYWGRNLDMDPVRMVGVETDYWLRTRVHNLESGRTLLVIDNRKNFREPAGSSLDWLLDSEPFIVLCVLLAAGSLVGFGYQRFRNRGRTRRADAKIPEKGK
jgi:hypothetical protein